MQYPIFQLLSKTECYLKIYKSILHAYDHEIILTNITSNMNNSMPITIKESLKACYIKIAYFCFIYDNKRPNEIK